MPQATGGPTPGRDEPMGIAAPPGPGDGWTPERTGPARTSAALRSAAVGYTAAHGDPVVPASRPRRRVRWAVSWRVAAGAGTVLLLVGGAVALRALSLAPGPAVALPVPAPHGAATAGASPTTEVVVDVVGAVAAPGVVHLAAGSRVVDAIAAAGSATAGAQLGALNLARPLVDGEQIVVPAVGDPPDAVGPGATSAPAGGDDRVDLNSADAAALDALPGIGPVLAGRIVAHREDGPFSSVDELADVAGIGPTLLERLRDLVRV
ncbi:MAG: helix-hairpin-helix domain-containing protein [Cellulomonas sp.]